MTTLGRKRIRRRKRRRNSLTRTSLAMDTQMVVVVYCRYEVSLKYHLGRLLGDIAVDFPARLRLERLGGRDGERPGEGKGMRKRGRWRRSRRSRRGRRSRPPTMLRRASPRGPRQLAQLSWGTGVKTNLFKSNQGRTLLRIVGSFAVSHVTKLVMNL